MPTRRMQSFSGLSDFVVNVDRWLGCFFTTEDKYVV